MATLKVALDVKKRSVKEKHQKNISLLSSYMRGKYILVPIDYGVHYRGVQLVELFEAPSA